MKLSKLFDAKIIVSGVAATILAGFALAYGRKYFPDVFRTASRGFDGNSA